MFRNRFWGGAIALLLFLLLAGMIGFAGYQMGLAQGGEAGLLGPGVGGGFRPPGFVFFPSFWGFGLLKFFFILLVFGFFFRLFFRPWRMGPGGHWKGRHEGRWGDHLKEMHDHWHQAHPEGDPQPSPDHPPD
jgi:hypothetical protein